MILAEDDISKVIIALSIFYALSYLRLTLLVTFRTEFQGCMKLFLFILMLAFGLFHIAWLLSSVADEWNLGAFLIGLFLLSLLLFPIISGAMKRKEYTVWHG